MLLWTALLIGCDDKSETDFVYSEDGEGTLADTGAPNTEDEQEIDEVFDDSSEVTWDAFPPADLEDGDRLEIRINCGLLDGPGDGIFVKSGDAWEVEALDAWMREELAACSDKSAPIYILWDDAPSMYLDAGGYDHNLVPDTTEGQWIGEVWPQGQISGDCQDAYDALGVTFPVIMTMTAELL